MAVVDGLLHDDMVARPLRVFSGKSAFYTHTAHILLQMECKAQFMILEYTGLTTSKRCHKINKNFINQRFRLEIVEVMDFPESRWLVQNGNVNHFELVYEPPPDNVGSAGVPPLQG